MPLEEDPASLFWLPQPAKEWAQGLREAVADDPTGRTLRGACTAQLGISQLRAVRTAIGESAASGNAFSALRHLRLGIVGSGTLDFLADAIPGTAPRFGLRIDVESVYYNAIANAVFGDAGLEGPFDVVAVVPDAGAFLKPAVLLDRKAHNRAVADAIAMLDRIVTSIRERFGCVVVLSTVPNQPDDRLSTGDRAIFGSQTRFVADLNAAVVDLANAQRLALWDVDSVASDIGTRVWRDPFALHVAKSPFAIGLAPLVADRLCAVLASLFGKSRRALVLDLDNTLWGGVIGDDGLAGIVIGQGDAVGEAHLALQRYALELRKRGVAIAVCSKNDDAVAREPFRSHPDMLLREEHVAVFQANWVDKATNLKSIADALALNIDSLVFVDDNPAERARIRQLFPEAGVPELPEDPAYYVSHVASAGYFENTALSAEDLTRAGAYQDNAKRAEIKTRFGDYVEYLQNLEMVLRVSRFDAMGRARVAQLINKSNQFNLTTRRRQESDVAAIESATDYIGLQFRLVDRFGDNGMISVVILKLEGTDALIDTWLMSCRVLERGIERAVLSEIVREAKAVGATRLVGEYIPTERNSMVSDHYKKLGFAPAGAGEDKTLWTLDIADYVPSVVQMTVLGNDALEPPSAIEVMSHAATGSGLLK